MLRQGQALAGQVIPHCLHKHQNLRIALTYLNISETPASILMLLAGESILTSIIAYLNPDESTQPQMAFQPNDYHVYQSRESLAPSTASASSGFYPPSSVPTPADISAEADRFRAQNDVFGGNTSQRTDPDYDRFGNLNEQAFKRSHPVVGQMLQDFVILACVMLYYEQVLQSWPDSAVLANIALKAVEFVLEAHAKDFATLAETSKFSQFSCRPAPTHNFCCDSATRPPCHNSKMGSYANALPSGRCLDSCPLLRHGRV
jgi:hypothetical protein